MRVTVNLTHTPRNRLDRSVRGAEKQVRRATTAGIRGSIRPVRGKKCLIRGPRQAMCRQTAGHLGNIANKMQNKGPVSSPKVNRGVPWGSLLYDGALD